MLEQRIPQSRNVLWRKFRSQLVPVLLFAMTALATGWLWQFHGTSSHGVGKVKSPRIDLTSPTAGLIVALPNQSGGQWLVYDYVRTGDVIAQIQDHELEVSKRLLRQDIDQLVQRFESMAPSDDLEMPKDWQEERTALMRFFERSISEEAAADATHGVDFTHQAMQPGGALEGQLDGQTVATEGEAVTGPLQSLIASRISLTRRWEDLSRRAGLLDIQAPISGTLVAVHCWPGQAVPPGGRIATIAADHGQQVIGFVPEHSRVMPEPGMRVALRTRIIGSTPIESEVEQVGQQVEQIPSHHRSGSSLPEWGIPVRIKMPADVPLRPGSLVDLTFYPEDAG